jgi:mRNA interferase HicA
MKRTELLKKLAQIGRLELVREGANHTLYRVNGNPVTIPRHREINELTAKAILKDAKGDS